VDDLALFIFAFQYLTKVWKPEQYWLIGQGFLSRVSWKKRVLRCSHRTFKSIIFVGGAVTFHKKLTISANCVFKFTYYFLCFLFNSFIIEQNCENLSKIDDWGQGFSINRVSRKENKFCDVLVRLLNQLFCWWCCCDFSSKLTFCVIKVLSLSFWFNSF
jgi:hypothetical protein